MPGPVAVMITEKTCTTCQITKPLAAFGPDKKGRGGVKSKCRDCRKVEWRDYQFERNLIRRYGITLAQYNQMLLEQNHCCAICQRPQTDFTRWFAVDHDHETGAVRGLLCSNCNQGLGHFQDDLMLLRAAIKYLEEADGER